MINERSNRTSSRNWVAVRRTAMILVLFVLAGCTRQPTIPSRPIPKGHAGIHVEFKSLPTDKFNKLTEFVSKLAESHSALVEGTAGERDVGEHNAYHGFWNNGFVDHTYKPNHAVPSPQVEASMKASLESFLQTNGIDGHDVKLELRYEQ